ncbi:hypothetical protein ACP8HZ_01190 [Francisella noatunensis]
MPEVVVGENCRLKKVVIDKGCDIPAGMVIGEGPIEDAKNFYRTDKGVVLVTKKMIDELKKNKRSLCAFYMYVVNYIQF